jgi:PEP-CTERM motif
MRVRVFRASLLVVYLFCPLAASASIINLLTNPGFEAGDFSGWTTGGTSTSFGVSTDGNLIAGTSSLLGPMFTNVRTGTYSTSAAVAAHEPVGLTLSQMLAVVPGGVYTVGFWVNADAPEDFGFGLAGTEILVNGVPLALTRPEQIDTINGFNGPGSANFANVFGTFRAAASQTSATVQFTLTGSGEERAGLNFDDFEVTAAVPEPRSLLLLGTGLAAVAARRRFKKRN